MVFDKASIGKKMEKHWQLAILICVAIVFFFSASYFNFKTQEYQRADGSGNDFVKWTSPDETANYIFTKFYAQEGKLSITEKYNLEVSDIMHPRSFRSDAGEMKPMSFLGIILVYGTIAKVFSYKIIPFLTPLFASFGIIAYYLLVKRIFGRRNAFISALLLSIFPVYFYYSMRSMFHNVLFIVFLVTGAYFLVASMQVRAYEKAKMALFVFFSGIFIGLAAITRSSELIWLAPALFLAWLLHPRAFGWMRPLFFAAAFMLAVSPALYYNDKLYGSALSGGYAEMNTSITTIRSASTELLRTTTDGDIGKIRPLFENIKKSVFYFGFDSGQSLSAFKNYFPKMFPLYFFGMLAGLAVFLFYWKEIRRRKIAFIILWAFSSAILVFYYGSWEFHDNPDPSRHTIGNSYTRYWLPLYLGAIPFFALAIEKISKLFAKAASFGKKNVIFFSARAVAIASVLTITAFISINYLLYGSEEGVAILYSKAKNSRTEWGRLMETIPANAAVITRYHDKLLFPERKVIVGDFGDNNMNKLYAVLAEKLPLYYYNFSLPQKDLAYLNDRRLPAFGMKISTVEKITDDFSLYRIERK